MNEFELTVPDLYRVYVSFGQLHMMTTPCRIFSEIIFMVKFLQTCNLDFVYFRLKLLN